MGCDQILDLNPTYVNSGQIKNRWVSSEVQYILSPEITEHKLYQIVVGVINFDPWPQQQAFTQRSIRFTRKENLDTGYAMFLW